MKFAKKLMVAATVLPLTLATTAAFAYGGHGSHKGGEGSCRGSGERGIWKQLDLTPEQQTQLQALKNSHREEMRANRAQKQTSMKALRAQERDLILAADFDQVAAEELAKQMVDQQVAQRVKMLEKRHQMASILTEEQKVKFATLQQARMDKKMHYDGQEKDQAN